jgi:nitroreductase
MMDALTALQTRTAAPRLVAPAPAAAELEQVLKAGLRAPDHGMLRPWRFLVVEGEAALAKLGELFVAARQPQGEDQIKKLREAPLRAPMVIIAVATIRNPEQIPALEQILSAGAAVQNMSVALHALGYGSIWRTGGVCYDERVNLALGLATTDQIVGYLYVGTPTFRERPVPELQISDFVQRWPA